MGGRTEKSPSGKITIADAQSPDSSTLTVDDVTTKIRAAYMPGLERCYVRLLVQEPTASGRVTLGFKVTPAGKTDGVNVTAFAATLAACMKASATAWRFRVPTDIRSMNPMVVHFRYGLVLTPD